MPKPPRQLGLTLPARAAVAILAALPLAGQGQSTFYAAYEDGLEAAKQGQWASAAAAFQRAIHLRPVSSLRVIIYGNNLLRDYYPHSHLAQCQLELGQPEAAALSLRQAEARGEPAGLREPLARRLPRGGEPRTQPDPPPVRETPVAAAPVEPVRIDPGKPAPAPVGPEPSAPVPTPLPVPDAQPRGEAGAAGPASSPAGVVGPAPAPKLTPAGAVAPVRTGPGPLPVRVQPQPEPIRPLSRLGWGLLGGALSGLVLLLWRQFRPTAGGGEPDRVQPVHPDPITVGPYRVLGVLGHGGFATTYLARRGDGGPEVALKVLHPHRLRDPEFASRFALEARLGALLDHPCLVRLVDPGPSEAGGWIAMEYVPGPTLESRLRTSGALPVEEAVVLALELAKGMAYAHAHGVVHRDLKPGNIILGRGGPKITDLGIARDLDGHTMTTTYAFLGTPLYAAPEAQRVAKVGPAADRYSLGVMLFEMLAGVPPYQGETPFAILDQHRSAPVPDITRHRAVSPALARLLSRLLAKEPEQRPEDGELVAKLERIRDHFDDAPTLPGVG